MAKSALAVRRERAAAAAAAAAAGIASNENLIEEKMTNNVDDLHQKEIKSKTVSAEAVKEPSHDAVTTPKSKQKRKRDRDTEVYSTGNSYADSNHERDNTTTKDLSERKSKSGNSELVVASSPSVGAVAGDSDNTSTKEFQYTNNCERSHSWSISEQSQSTYRPPPLYSPRFEEPSHNAIQLDDNSMICGMTNDAINLRGQFLVQVLHGTVSVALMTLTPNSPPFLVYAPDVYPAAELLAESTEKSSNETQLKGFHAVIRFTPFSNGLEHIGRACPLAGTNPLPSFLDFIQDASQDALRVPTEWKSSLFASKDSQDCVAMIRGPKNSGKSVFSRLLLNTLLEHNRFIAYLDLDVGQPEFGPAGVIALYVFDARESQMYGPSWAVQHLPLRAHFFGDVSPREDPHRYQSQIAELVEYYTRELRTFYDDSSVLQLMSSSVPAEDSQKQRTMPLVVNTHGWTKGLGSDLVDQAAQMLNPSHVFELNTPSLPAFGDTSCGRHAAATRRRRLNAVEIRTLNMMSYLHMTQIPRPGNPYATWDFTSLVAQRPWVVDVANGLPGGLEILPYGGDVDRSLALHALNGAIVALTAKPKDSEVCSEDVAMHTPSSERNSIWHMALDHGKTPDVCAIGLALIRSIDRDHKTMNLLTPIHPSILSQFLDSTCAHLALVKGAVDPPVWCALDQKACADVLQPRDINQLTTLAGVPRDQVPYLSWPTELLSSNVIGAAPRKVRRNLMRRSQR
ncbi:Polynucleotide 5'-hydroxyl-kinase grc3 [Malassezia yamatoensis]|uniref:Polynucleotide 5'-hydroxyl-kinase GRC3 n=1 Tax=Malassezia yamatoensis TaxID=253288 RepID=A0AAJ6CHB3_9BASI|nr:Polynucleotide 5'-hydroxyl-kinase grc3 [Malassezia yamatoensis]